MPEREEKNCQDWTALLVDVDPDDLKTCDVDFPALFYVHPNEHRPGFRKRSEENFAKLMTQRARALGMANTTYVNASGLPDDGQVTTAKDQALLGRAIYERFPRYYKYFSTEAFVYGGEVMRNHNHLLGAVEGVDGIKTGYTRTSGFNLITSVHRGGRHIIAVILGGRTASERDAHMRKLPGL
jgi:D-alanyl-D-alanine carboxypeptidase